ncbi:MAG: CRISPR-associated endoribonuclease Cas6 [Thermonemataceae bacterium]|nr:CRISPR-associated endoribonuclease Cas6 [Thermonemataceae bacterium]
MRFNLVLTFKKTSKNLLSFNYQYELSSWIYGVIAQADEAYSHFLHQTGYEIYQKRFKLFCFSNLYFPKYQLHKDYIEILSSEFSFLISFYIDSASEKFIRGIFENQKGSIGNKAHQIDFLVSRVEAKPLLLNSERVRLKTLSPLVVAYKNTAGKDDYLQPSDAKFKEIFLQNLLDKYRATGKEIPPEWQHYDFGLEVFEPIRSKLISLKNHTEHPIRIKGYVFEFVLQAPIALLELGLLAGFGKHNAEGFGFCEVVER